jgi:hypothetical protein
MKSWLQQQQQGQGGNDKEDKLPSEFLQIHECMAAAVLHRRPGFNKSRQLASAIIAVACVLAMIYVICFMAILQNDNEALHNLHSHLGLGYVAHTHLPPSQHGDQGMPQQFSGITYAVEGHRQANYTLTYHHDIVKTVPVTIVCQLSGEMGNNLGKLGRCLSLKWWLESGASYNSTRKYGYSARVALRHQQDDKWVRGQRDLQRCFPNTNQFDFSEANNKEFAGIWKMQHQLFGGNERVGTASPFNEINAGPEINAEQQIVARLKSFTSAAYERHSLLYNAASKRNISLPFLFSNRFQLVGDPLSDKFYHQHRQFFRFSDSCCNLKADPDESVFHYRNFKHELPTVWDSYGFHEADPQQAANDLLGHLMEGDKIAIVTRFSGESAQSYVEAFEARGLKVRVVDGQDGPADFCFLMSARKEVVGLTRSSYFMWASYLGNATRVIAYSMASSNKGLQWPKFTSSGLKGKYDFRVIQ